MQKMVGRREVGSSVQKDEGDLEGAEGWPLPELGRDRAGNKAQSGSAEVEPEKNK